MVSRRGDDQHRGKTHWLWRAVDRNGAAIDILVQSRRDAKAAKRLLDTLLKKQGVAPRVMTFRVMVGIGMLMLAVSWFSSWQLIRKGQIQRQVAYALVAMTFAGWIATLSGWYVTEIGRQPWLVTGILTTKQAASAVSAPMIAATLIGYLLLYGALLAAYIATVFYLARKSAVSAVHESNEPVRVGGATVAGDSVATTA